MSELLDALTDPAFPFLRRALLVGLAASAAFGVLGTFVVARRITYMADAMAHCVLGGIGAAILLRYNYGFTQIHPLWGAWAAAAAAAVCVGLISFYAREREDTIISMVWVAGVAAGLLLLEQARPPAGEPVVEPLSYLFGDILLISPDDVRLVLVLDVVVLAAVALFYNKLVAVCFDEEFASLRGIPARLYFLMLLCLTALTIVLLVRVVGILLVVALLTLPAALAGRFSRHLWQMMLLAAVFCALLVTTGLAVSYHYETRTGPTIALAAVAAYGIAAAGGAVLRRWQRKESNEITSARGQSLRADDRP